MTQSADYQKGYRAGSAKGSRRLKEANELILHLRTQLAEANSQRKERVFLKCLELTLTHCKNWTIGGEQINNAQGYTRLASIFASESISKIDE